MNGDSLFGTALAGLLVGFCTATVPPAEYTAPAEPVLYLVLKFEDASRPLLVPVSGEQGCARELRSIEESSIMNIRGPVVWYSCAGRWEAELLLEEE